MAVVTVLYVTAHGATISATQQPGNSPGSVGGFDVQRAGSNSFCAVNGAVYRATTLGGAYTSYYAITGGVQAVCIIVPYKTWSGADNTANANPDIIVAFSGADGSGRRLVWIEGGATPGTVHDIGSGLPAMLFDNPNCVTVSYQHHLAIFGSVSGTYHLYTSNNQGTTWVDRGSLTSPHFIRVRRNDNRAKTSATNLGQIFLTSNSKIGYTSKWASGGGSIAGLFPRNVPFVPIGHDTVF